jgi:four helix bundle protein
VSYRNYEEWEDRVPRTIKDDPLWRMKVYRLALFIGELGWKDVTKLYRDQRTITVAGQLYRALGSIGANISEGFSRGAGKARAQFYEYALGSARESRNWYFQSRYISREDVFAQIGEILT